LSPLSTLTRFGMTACRIPQTEKDAEPRLQEAWIPFPWNGDNPLKQSANTCGICDTCGDQPLTRTFSYSPLPRCADPKFGSAVFSGSCGNKREQGGVVRGNCSLPLRCDPSAFLCALKFGVLSFCVSAIAPPPCARLAGRVFSCRLRVSAFWVCTGLSWRAPMNRMGSPRGKKSPKFEGKARIIGSTFWARKRNGLLGALSFHKKTKKGACWFAFDRYKGSSQCVQMGEK